MFKNNLIKTNINDALKNVEIVIRDGTPLSKGVTLTQPYLESIEDLLKKYINYFIQYPDMFLDLIKPQDTYFNLFFYQRIVLRALMKYKEVYISACLKPDTPVLTEYGMKPIKDINPNWKVWSDGQWREIENVNRCEWHGNLVKLDAENCFEDKITVTDNHKFLVVRRKNNTTRPGIFWKDGLQFFNISNYNSRKEFYRKALREIEPEWVEAKDLMPNDWLLSSIDLKIEDIDAIKVPEAPPRTINVIKPEIKLDNEFYEWLGIWLAKGSWNNSSFSFTISTEEDRLRDRIQDLTYKIFGLKSTIYEKLDNHKRVIQINSAHLNVFFEKLFGCTSEEINQWNKWIPQKLLHCKPSKQLQLVKGWLDGDGYYRKSGNCHRYKGTTVSNLLAEGIKHILYRNFVNPSITTENRENKAKVFNINFNGALAWEFEDSINNNRSVVIDESMRLGEYYPKKYNNKFYMINKVRSVDVLLPDNEDVYCLQLENGIFNVNGVEGHNCRAFSKSFLTILGMILQCIFMPRTKRFICAPNKNQAAQIAKEKIYEIYALFPLLRKEVVGGATSNTPGNFGKDYVTLTFRNGSILDVVGALDSTRGGRRHGGLIDEIRDHEEDTINNVVLPLMNVSRRLPDGTVNPTEPNRQVMCMTSAGSKSSFSYDKLIDMFENSIITPNQSFIMGCDYRVPVMHGLLDRVYINQLKMSPSYSEESFASEYMSIWGGGTDESWINFDKISKYRKIKNPEKHAIFRANSKGFYLLSVDVGRVSDSTVVCVWRVNINSYGIHYATLVNIFVLGLTLETKPFACQAADLKGIIRDFSPREVVIDTNGLGVGLGDEMIRPSVNSKGEILPAYGFINDPVYKKIQPQDAPCILYGIKAGNSSIRANDKSPSVSNSDVNSNVYTRITSGRVRFLIKEQDAKSALLSTKVGQKMTQEQRIKRLMPHELTTKLFEEIANLRMKKQGIDLTLERINSRKSKDKFSAMAYGLWRIKELEDEYLQRIQRNNRNSKRRLIFYD